MSTPEHRAGAGGSIDPRLVIAGIFLLGALVGAGVAGVVAAGVDDSTPDESKVTGTSASSPTLSGRQTSPSPGSPHSPSSPPDDAEQHAQMTKPLADLEPGDRVVYNVKTCRFRSWVGDGLRVALIDCPDGPPFEVRTEYLVPVEPGGD
jgi:hypothetical protein